MEDRVVEKKTVIERRPGQTTNVNVRPDGGADVQVNDDTPAGGTEVIEVTRETTVERRP